MSRWRIFFLASIFIWAPQLTGSWFFLSLMYMYCYLVITETKTCTKQIENKKKSLKIYSFLYLKNISVYHTRSFQKPKINLNPSYILTHLSSWMTLFLGEAISDMVLLNTFCCVSSISFIAMFSMWGGCSKKHLVETWDSTRGGVFSKPWLQYKYST